MSTLFAFLFLISLVLLIVGLIKPAISLKPLKINKSRKSVLLVFGSLSLIFMVLGTATMPKTNTVDKNGEKNDLQSVTSDASSPSPSSETGIHEINAEVRFSDTAFQIKNNEGKEWNDCKFEMNSGLVRGGYIYRQANVSVDASLIVPFSDFTKGDGTRFDFTETKPQNLSIFCTDVDGKTGSNYFGIN